MLKLATIVLSMFNTPPPCINNMFWCHDNYIPQVITNHFIDNPCEILLSHGITRIKFAGDSFVRQTYQGMVIWLTNNYKNSTMVPGTEDCDFERQFDLKQCRMRIKRDTWVCDNKVKISLELAPWYKPKQKDFTLYDKFIFGGGWHTHNGNSKCNPMINNGQNDAHFVERLIVDKTCVKHKIKPKQAYYLAIHDHFDHSYCYFNEYDYEERYVKEMIELFERKCVNINVLTKPREMTKDIVRRFLTTNYSSISYDGTHYGMYVNLLKAHEVLREILL